MCTTSGQRHAGAAQQPDQPGLLHLVDVVPAAGPRGGGKSWWDPVVDAASRFAALVAAASGEPGVQLPDSSGGRRFGSEAVRLAGSIVAMLVQDRVVLKLPRERVEALIAVGEGAPFDNGRRQPMREWVALTGDPAGDIALLQEALDLARSRAQSG
jgi:hypothetical protein